MVDVHDRQTRTYNMSQIKGKNTRPEMIIRRYLFANGIRYRLHDKTLLGKPDIAIKKYKTIVDIRGCFWHGHHNCKFGDKIKSDSVGIMERVSSAIQRDKRNEEIWKQLGWNVIIVWDTCELEVKKKTSERREKILTNLLNNILKNGDTSN
jgi:DNA mismatch endonuclease, patch repair protein